MKKLDKIIIEFITKYPFVTDPIVLFNPHKIPGDKEIEKGMLGIKYPEIEKLQGDLEIIKKDFYLIIEKLQETKFKNLFLKIEYSERLKDFYKVIRIIEIFYQEKEYEKYNLINEYFGIDFELLEEIFCNKDILFNEFKCDKPLLSEKKVKELEETTTNSDGIKYYFDEALKFLGLQDNWKVSVGDAVSIVHTNFNDKGGEILIPKIRNINIKTVLLLIAHEIDGHCMQFSNCPGLFSGGIRYSQSESLVEGFAMYNEYLFGIKIYGENNIKISFELNKARFDFIENNVSLRNFLDSYKGNIFRTFRGFSNISTYRNTKDFVYIQGIYTTIINMKKYNNFIELVESGAINDSYIHKYGKTEGSKKKVDITKTSAYFMLKEYLKK